MPRVRLLAALATTLALLAGGLAGVPAPPQAQAAAAPAYSVTRVVGGLRHPWDLTWVGPVMLFDQRAGGVWSKRGTARPRRVTMALPPVYAHNEGGMLGMVAAPDAARSKLFYTCMAVATASGRPRDVEVWKWRLTDDTHAQRVQKVIGGLPLSSGRHSGCRLRFRSAHALYIGTGDAAQHTNPQNLQSLGGKVLRVRDDGTIPTENPFYRRGGNARYVWTYGHRNVQGLMVRPGTHELWSVEHGSSRDDEVNRVLLGHNYGWNPGPGYDESPPMTDLHRYPHAVRARWSSGRPTKATSGGTFLSGARWKSWNGRLAVGMLKNEGILLFAVDRAGRITGQQTLLHHRYGRIRTAQQGPDGNLWFTTDNGADDSIYRLTPR